MIKYNSKTLNNWNFGATNIIKVYRNNAIVFYKVSGGSPTPEYKVCYAVVDDITKYTDREFEDVYDKATKKWYKLNNINQYEEYGVYGKGRNITYYQGKLTVDDGYEYEWNGSEWVNIGEVTGTTATLPDVPFTVNYNAKNYNSSTQTFAKTNGQLADTDVTITSGTLTAHDGYVTVATNSRGIINGYGNYFNRTDSTPNLTIISKQRTEGINCHMFANRSSSGSYNWMYRPYSNKLTLHGNSEQGDIAVTTQPVIESVRIGSNRLATYNNYTDNTSNTKSNFKYGGKNGSVALFAGYTDYSGEWFVGDFYWIYMSQTTLTDEQVQQVINYNESVEKSEYPKYYSEKSDPLNDLTFNTLAEAQTYAYNNCVYDGMRATIDGNRYYFDSKDKNVWVKLTEYFTVDLNSQWQNSTSYGSLSSDTANYDFYESFGNYNVSNGKATMFITIEGYASFTFKVRNYSENSYDYVVVNNLDDTTVPSWQPSQGSGIASNGKVYYTNKGKSSYTTWYDVTFNDLDGGEHIITVTYGKDSIVNSNDDRGYVAIPKKQ